MIRRLLIVAVLFATPGGAQICRGHQSFAAHRARAAMQVLNPKKAMFAQYTTGLAYGLTRHLFVSGDYVGELFPVFESVDDAITYHGGEGFVGVQFGDERLGTFALCPLLGFGFRGANGTTLLGSSDIDTRSTIVGLALGAGAPLLSSAGIRLLPSIEVQKRSDRSEGTSTVFGITNTINSKDRYLVATAGLGVARGQLTFTPLYQHRFDGRLTSWGFRVSYNFGSAID